MALTRVPLEMVEGASRLRFTPGIVRYFFTDGTYADVELPVPAAFQATLTALEAELVEHFNAPVALAHPA